MGVHGMDLRTGFTSPNFLEAETNRALVEAGRRLVVTADHTKWGIIGISSFARLDQADALITDTGLDRDACDILTTHVRQLTLVEPAPEPDGSLPRVLTDGRPIADASHTLTASADGARGRG